MNCDESKTLITDLVYGELAPGRREELERHLGSCAACRAEHDAVARTARALDAWSPIESASDARAVAAAAASTARVGRTERRRLPAAVVWMAAAAAVIVVVIGAVRMSMLTAALETERERVAAMAGDVEDVVRTVVSEVVRDEIRRDRAFVLDAVEGMLGEWGGEQDRRLAALVDVIGAARVEDAQRTQVALDDVVRIVLLDQELRNGPYGTQEMVP